MAFWETEDSFLHKHWMKMSNVLANVCSTVSSLFQCAALVGEDQPLCPDLPELDLSELDVSDLDADSFLGGLKWYSDQSEIISSQYGNEASNLFEVKRVMQCFLIWLCMLVYCKIRYDSSLMRFIASVWNSSQAGIVRQCSLLQSFTLWERAFIHAVIIRVGIMIRTQPLSNT